MTTEKLARQLNVPLRSVQRWRSGESQPSGAALSRLCLALGKPIDFFYENGEAA